VISAARAPRARDRAVALAITLLAVAIGFLAGRTDDQLPVALAVAALGALLGCAFIVARSRREDARFLCGIFLAGIALRCAIALVNHYMLPHGFFAYDDGRYNEVGRQLAAWWRQDGPFPAYIAHGGQVGWFYVNGAITWLFGFVPLVPAFLNCVIGPLCGVIVFHLVRDHFDARAARRAAVLAMFFPSVMLWSSLNLKDAATVLCIVLVLAHSLALQRRFRPLHLVGLLLFLTLLGTLRSYLFIITGVSVIGSLMIGRLGVSPRGVVIGLLLMVSFVGVYQRFGFGREVVASEGLKTANEIREEMAEGDSAYEGDAEISSPMKAISFLPVGLGYFLFAPAPWQIWNLRQALTFPEMLLWYALLPAVWRGVRYAFRERFGAATALLGPGVVLTVAYALVESNLGTAYRHRAQVLVIYLIFAAIGLAHRRGRAPEVSRAAEPAPAPGFEGCLPAASPGEAR
jgi:hypothetical protein